MDISDRNRLLDEFQAVHGWRYKYVARTWWVWVGSGWLYQGSLERMGMALAGIAGEIFPKGHKIHRHLERDYMIRDLARILTTRLHADMIPGDPTGFPRSFGPPAPGDQPEPGQLSEPGPRPAAPTPAAADPGGTASAAGHTP